MFKQIPLFTIFALMLMMLPQASAAQPSAPPIVVQTTPLSGEEYPLDEPVSITFDQPMNQATVEQAFAIEPGATADGSFTWVDDSTVTFALNNGFQRGQRYRLRIVETAESAAGESLNRPFELIFHAAGYIEVTNTQPADGDIEILPESIVTVAFNRPVVPLSAIGEDVVASKDVLAFEPPVSGEGAWLNSSIYQFTPTEGFAPATTYTALVNEGLSDMLDLARLEDGYTWQFTTVTPAAIGSIPLPQNIYVSPTPVISLTFNQPMNRASVVNNLSLTPVDGGSPIPLADFGWHEKGMILPEQPNDYGYYEDSGLGPESIGVETVSFSPTQPLENEATYQLTLAAGTEGAIPATATTNDYQATFTVIPLPEIVNSAPFDGNDFVNGYDLHQTDITFNGPMDPDTLTPGEDLTIEYRTFDGPTLVMTPTEIYTNWYNTDTQLSLNFPRWLNTAYTMTIGAGVSNRYGQPLGEETVIRWKTLNQAPAVRILSPRVATYNGYEPSRVYLTVRNMSKATFTLSRLSREEFIDLTGGSWYELWDNYQPDAANEVRTWEMETDPQLFMNHVYELSLTADDTPLEPGLYYLEGSPAAGSIYPEVEGVGFDRSEARVLVAVSNYNITLKKSNRTGLAWLTDLQSGEPVGGVPIDLLAKPWDGETFDLAQGESGADGVALFEFEPLPENNMDNPFYAIGPTGADFAIAMSDWDGGIQRWEYNGVITQDWQQQYNGYLYTDRNIFRPGQTVNFKGIMRVDDDAFYQLPPDSTINVTMSDSQWRTVYSETLPLNEWGSFQGSFELDESAALGGYSLNAMYEGSFSLYQSFDVAAYRKPDFMVTVQSDKPEYAQGETIKLTAEASYLSGGAVANAAVRWTVLADDYQFDYAGEGNYSFIDLEPNEQTWYGFGEEIASGVGETDSQGRFSVTVPAEIGDKRNSQQLTLEVAVTGLNNQEIAQQSRAIVHKGEVYAGIQADSYINNAGDPAEVAVIAVDWQSRGVANQPIEVIFAQQGWYSVQQQDPEMARTGNPSDSFYWENVVQGQAIYSETVTSDPRGQAKASFIPPEGGSYRVYARTVDADGNQLFASTYLWVSGGGYINWGQSNDDRIQLVADKAEYNVGETAQVMVPHPFSGTVQSLITLERGHVYSYQVVTLETNSDQVAIPISEELAPNMYVSAVVVQGSGDTSAYQGANSGRPLPGFKVGYVNLPIEVTQKALTIELFPNADSYQPGDEVSFDIQVTDWAGEPVEAELSLALVDKAILTLAPERVGEMFDTFWQERGLGVKTGVGLTLAIDRVNQIIDAKKGGGGGDGPMGIDSVREAFADVPIWKPQFKTDADGRGTVQGVLPDNLTTWVLIAKGITAEDARIGEAQSEIVASKPLQVRPVLPRFLVVGDEAQVGMIVQNNTAAAIEIMPYFEADGLSFEPLYDEEPMSLAARGEIKLLYQVTALPLDTANVADTTGLVTVTMAVSSTEHGDALSLALPLYQASTPETVATVGLLSEDGLRTEGIILPEQYDPTQGGLTVKLDATLASGMVDGLQYLEHYPYESTEATVSRFLPNVVTYRAYQQLGLDTEKPTALINTALQRLYNRQHGDGGWGWWGSDPSQPFLSGYVLLGLVEAEKAGFAVDATVKDRAVGYLLESLTAPKDVAAAWQGNEQAFILYVLSQTEARDFQRAAALFEVREQMDMFGRAYLAMAMAEVEPSASQIDTLINDLSSAAIVSATGAHWEEAQVDYYAMNTDTRSTAIIVAALARLQPDHTLLPQAVRWLMSVRQHGGYWESTQETAWAIIGLTDWMVASGELAADYQWQVSLNGAELGGAAVQPDDLAVPTTLTVEVAEMTADINRLTLERSPTIGGASNGNLYYGAYLTTFIPAAEVTALDRGVLVSRHYSVVDAPENRLDAAAVGQVIQVNLNVIVPQDMHYVQLEDPFPAGLEGVDTTLATTSVTNQETELERTDSVSPYGFSNWLAHEELRDERMVLFATYLPKGTYEYHYFLRASTPGEFTVLPPHVEEVYFPEVFGRGDGRSFEVTE